MDPRLSFEALEAMVAEARRAAEACQGGPAMTFWCRRVKRGAARRRRRAPRRRLAVRFA